MSVLTSSVCYAVTFDSRRIHRSPVAFAKRKEYH